MLKMLLNITLKEQYVRKICILKANRGQHIAGVTTKCC